MDRLKPQPGLDRNGVRPYLTFRMPTFNFSPNELQTLVRFFMAMSGQQEPYIKEPLQPLTEQEKTDRATDVHVGHTVFEVSYHRRSRARCESDCAKLPVGRRATEAGLDVPLAAGSGADQSGNGDAERIV